MLQKLYHTKTTDLIEQFIQSKTEQGFTATELSEFLKQNGLSVNKTTVYRNLDKLTEAGKLFKHKSNINDGFIYQSEEKEKRCSDHIHFQCSKCDSLIHITDKKTMEFLDSISESLNLEIDLSKSTLNGLCPKCRSQK